VSLGARLASPRLTRDRLTRTLLLALERCCDAAKVTTDVKTERSYAEKENRVAQSMDQGRHSRTQGAFESANVCREGRQGDETDRRGGAAEGNDDRHRPRSPTLTTSPVCPYGLGSVIVITGAIVRLSQCALSASDAPGHEHKRNRSEQTVIDIRSREEREPTGP
jgi:hypothetical protein